MMRLFKGQSVQTVHMKQKPIKEGYKFWSICCAQSGFCWTIIPAAQIKKLLERTTVRDYSRTQSAYEQVVAEVLPNPTKKEKDESQVTYVAS